MRKLISLLVIPFEQLTIQPSTTPGFLGFEWYVYAIIGLIIAVVAVVVIVAITRRRGY